MARYVYALLTIFIIELALWLFAGTDYSQSALFSLLSDPASASSSSFYLKIKLALQAFGAAAIIAGFIFSKNTAGIYAGVAGAFLTYAFVIADLYKFIFGQLTERLGTADPFALTITSLIVAPLLLYFLMATLEWVRSNQ